MYLNTPENAEVTSRAGIAFEANNLDRSLSDILRTTEQERTAPKQLAVARFRTDYAVANDYEVLLTRISQRRSAKTIDNKISEDSHS
jgi:hypothetical protein